MASGPLGKGVPFAELNALPPKVPRTESLQVNPKLHEWLGIVNKLQAYAGVQVEKARIRSPALHLGVRAYFGCGRSAAESRPKLRSASAHCSVGALPLKEGRS